MSSSSEIVDSGNVSGARMPERSNFSQTCSLLSQYIKEKGKLGDLNLGINNGMSETYRQTAPVMATAITMNLFPVVEKQNQSSTPSLSRNSSFTNFSSQQTKSKFESAPMTIFYGGQVIVLNDVPAEKAKEVMLFATAHSCKNFTPANLVNTPTQFTRPIVAADLPIARKASLTRFLEKRKDRITAKAPYPISGALKKEESNDWLGLGALPPTQS